MKTVVRSQAYQSWTLTPARQRVVDERAANLAGTSNWVRASVPPMRRRGSLKANDIYVYVSSPMDYIFFNMIPEDAANTFHLLNDIIRTLLQATCPHDDTPAAEPTTTKLKLRVP